MSKRRQRAKGGSVTASSSTPKQSRSSKTAWKLMDRSTSLAATAAAPLLAGGAWRLVTGRKPPTASDNPEVELREAIGWAIVGGALVQVVKVGVRRQTAQYWVRSTGQLPPGMKGVKGEVMAREVAEAKAEHTAATRKKKRTKR
ncbi:DUF4235 domain-containing protein [Aeromicrobium sp. Leaf350]|uniref:DUF4235 domain-containing protein n=1 Tax=Aeromicrobium sp. Leaf350 TaxID=2876565 RepID=UPI001E5968F2|nr:DUF4235 domain-containing protein [Aeromicrobium sp. Leaf350]